MPKHPEAPKILLIFINEHAFYFSSHFVSTAWQGKFASLLHPYPSIRNRSPENNAEEK